MTNSTTIKILLAIAFLGCLFTYASIAFGNVASTNLITDRTEKYTFFATSTSQTVFSTSTTAVSTAVNSWTDSNGRIDNGYFVVEGADRVTFFFQREGKFGNTGSSRFDVDVSYDGSTWLDFDQLVLNGATSTIAYQAFATLSGTTTAFASMNLHNHNFYAVRCNVTETTDGEHFCRAIATY